ncbi:hypothetical protein HK101_007929, partial [Irineochytrium annulatum]
MATIRHPLAFPISVLAVVLSALSLLMTLNILSVTTRSTQPPSDSFGSSQTAATVPECDLYELPGRLDVNDQTWKASLVSPPKHCHLSGASQTKDHLAAIRQSSRDVNFPLPKAFHNKLLLIVGDSNDRNVIDNMCDSMEGDLRHVFADSGDIIPDAWFNNGDNRFCVVRPGRSPKLQQEKQLALQEAERKAAEEALAKQVAAQAPAAEAAAVVAPVVAARGEATKGQDGVFVILFVFQYGLANEDGDT